VQSSKFEVQIFWKIKMMLTRPDNAFGKFTALFPFSPIEIAGKKRLAKYFLAKIAKF